VTVHRKYRCRWEFTKRGVAGLKRNFAVYPDSKIPKSSIGLNVRYRGRDFLLLFHRKKEGETGQANKPVIVQKRYRVHRVIDILLQLGNLGSMSLPGIRQCTCGSCSSISSYFLPAKSTKNRRLRASGLLHQGSLRASIACPDEKWPKSLIWGPVFFRGNSLIHFRQCGNELGQTAGSGCPPFAR